MEERRTLSHAQERACSELQYSRTGTQGGTVPDGYPIRPSNAVRPGRLCPARSSDALRLVPQANDMRARFLIESWCNHREHRSSRSVL
jgi:hypothetical protein